MPVLKSVPRTRRKTKVKITKKTSQSDVGEDEKRRFGRNNNVNSEINPKWINGSRNILEPLRHTEWRRIPAQ